MSRLAEYAARMPRQVSEELRGWSEPPLLHTSSVFLTVSEATYQVCPTGRDVCLKRVARVKPAPPPEVGYVVHAAYSASVSAAKMLALSGVASGQDFLDSMRARFEEFVHGLCALYVGAGLPWTSRLSPASTSRLRAVELGPMNADLCTLTSPLDFRKSATFSLSSSSEMS